MCIVAAWWRVVEMNIVGRWILEQTNIAGRSVLEEMNIAWRWVSQDVNIAWWLSDETNIAWWAPGEVNSAGWVSEEIHMAGRWVSEQMNVARGCVSEEICVNMQNIWKHYAFLSCFSPVRLSVDNVLWMDMPCHGCHSQGKHIFPRIWRPSKVSLGAAFDCCSCMFLRTNTVQMAFGSISQWCYLVTGVFCLSCDE